MDFTKFVDLISRGTLYFARSDTLGDAFEGTYTAIHLDLDRLKSDLSSSDRDQLLGLKSFEIRSKRQ